MKGSAGIFSAPPPLTAGNEPTSFVAITQQQAQQAQQQQKMQETYGNGDRQMRPARTDRNERNDRERRTSGTTYNSNINNNQEPSSQIFVGNLPTQASEDELRELFGPFGLVTDVRIYSKPQQNNTKGRPVPNYGFITFEDPESVIKLQNAGVSLNACSMEGIVFVIIIDFYYSPATIRY